MTLLSCPICGGTGANSVRAYQSIGAQKYACSLVQCSKCGHYFTKATAEADTSELYESEQYELVDTRRSIFGRLISHDVLTVLRQLARVANKPSGSSVLDFGCGKGVFLYHARERGWRATGIETATKRAGFAKTVYGLTVMTDLYSGGKVPGGPFDVITLFHVLEHLPHPTELLKSLIEHNLAADGVLVVEVPRFDSLQSAMAGSSWIHLDPPRHLSHFSTEALTKLLRSLGLQIVGQSQFSFHNGVLGMAQSLMSRLGYRKMLIEEIKFRKTGLLMITLAAILPVATLIEIAAGWFNRGGIVRFYCTRLQNNSALPASN